MTHRTPEEQQAQIIPEQVHHQKKKQHRQLVINHEQEFNRKDVPKRINKVRQVQDRKHKGKMIKQVDNIMTNDKEMIMMTNNPDNDNEKKIIDTNEIMTMMNKMNNRKRKGWKKYHSV